MGLKFGVKFKSFSNDEILYYNYAFACVKKVIKTSLFLKMSL